MNNADTLMKCKTRRRYDETNAAAIAAGLPDDGDIGPCIWTGMSSDEIDDAISEPGGSCVARAHRERLERIAGMSTENK